MLRVLISAGEISGDAYGAALLRELRRICKKQPIEAYGIGGDLLRAEGMELYAHASETGVMGFWEVAKRARFFTRLLKKITSLLDTRRPDLLLTIDYTGFNLRLAARAKKRGIKTVHFVCPQVWAWNKKRIPKIAATLDKLICLFPFEPPLFDGTGLDAVFRGHPLPEQIAESLKEPAPENLWEGRATASRLADEGRACSPSAPTAVSEKPPYQIALFPGSRTSEISRILPIELEAAVLLEKRVGPCAFTIPAPTRKAFEIINAMLPTIPHKPPRLLVIEGYSRHILAQADAAAVKSGTSTLEACILRCPEVIVYKISAFSAFIIKRLVTKIKFVGLPNILAGKQICRELIQNDFTALALADELERLITDTLYRDSMLHSMNEINSCLCGDSATAHAADEIAKVL